jgi:nucleotide-binding universal stress UspA family protein
MFKSLMVPTDGSPLSEKAAAVALEFARQVDGSIVALSVAQPFPFYPLAENRPAELGSLVEDGPLQAAKGHVQVIAQLAAAAGVPCETVVVRSANPYEEIVGVASNMECDAIFIATHGRKGLSRLFLGSETQKVLAHARIPVMVIPGV